MDESGLASTDKQITQDRRPTDENICRRKEYGQISIHCQREDKTKQKLIRKTTIQRTVVLWDRTSFFS